MLLSCSRQEEFIKFDVRGMSISKFNLSTSQWELYESNKPENLSKKSEVRIHFRNDLLGIYNDSNSTEYKINKITTGIPTVFDCSDTKDSKNQYRILLKEKFWQEAPGVPQDCTLTIQNDSIIIEYDILYKNKKNHQLWKWILR
jgi:hypothetical protein